MAAIKKIICPKCGAKLKFDPDKITSEVVKFKCPGCKTAIRIKKPGSPDPKLSSTQITDSSGPSGDTIIQARDATSLAQPEKPVSAGKQIPETTEAAESALKAPATEPPLPEKSDEKIPDALMPHQEDEKTSSLPEDQPGTDFDPQEPLLEEYKHDKLGEYEEGEAGADDYEWTRYAEKKESKLPKTAIDLDLIPVTESDLHETLADLQQAEVYNLQGEANLEKNLLKQALRDFNNALDINPDYVDALVNRGSAYVLQNRYNEALEDLNHALDLEKRQGEIYNLRGEIYLLNKLYDKAIKDFTSAIILDPTYSDAYLNRARSYTGKEMNDEAESDYNQAVRAEPEKFDRIFDLDGSEVLFAEDETAKKEKAAEHVTQGIENLKKENYHEAIECLTQAIDLLPNIADPYILRGQAYIQMSRPDEAMVDLKNAVIFDPLNPVLYYWRAMAWKAMDSPLNMVADFKISCELGYGPACAEYQKHKPQKH